MQQLEQIKKTVADDLLLLKTQAKQYLSSPVNLITEVKQHIFADAGKQIRPLIVLLISHSHKYTGTQHIALAAIIEFLHVAMLLHDDVVDDSILRRGKKSVNDKWDNATSILVGDFIYSRSFQMMANLEQPQILQILAQATNYIAEGEVIQLMQRGNSVITEDSYMEIIGRKTAKLFELAVETALVLSGTPQEYIDQVKQYGWHLGLAFQIVDDVLDYTGSTNTMGKNLGDDWSKGNLTLPIIYALSNSDKQQKTILQHIIHQRQVTDLPQAIQLIQNSGGLQYALNQAHQHINIAQHSIESLPQSVYKNSLHDLASLVMNRKK